MKKLILVFCTVALLLLASCGKEQIEREAEAANSANREESADVQEASEEAPDTELKVNFPLAEDNEIGGLYNVVTGSFAEVTNFLEKALTDILENSTEYEYQELYHSFVLVDKDFNAASGMLRASYEDGYVYESVFSIMDALQVGGSMLVKWYETSCSDVIITFTRSGAMWADVYSDGTNGAPVWVTFTGDYSDRNEWLREKLAIKSAEENPMILFSGDRYYYVFRGSWDADAHKLSLGEAANISSEVNTAGQPIFMIDIEAYNTVAEEIAG